MRRAAKVDANHRAIAAALRKCGCEVLSLAAVANGCPDLLVFRDGHGLFLLEVKDGRRPPSERKLTRHQKAFVSRWPVHVVTDEEEALRAVGLR